MGEIAETIWLCTDGGRRPGKFLSCCYDGRNSDDCRYNCDSKQYYLLPILEPRFFESNLPNVEITVEE